MIEIVLDTETTGLSVKEGHRIVEIGCIELDNLIPTSKKLLGSCFFNLSKPADVDVSADMAIIFLFFLASSKTTKPNVALDPIIE